MLRTLEVQNVSLNAIGVQPAEVVIAPEVADFDLSEFMRAKELFAIGEKAALVQIPKIQQLLARLDPVLFGSANNAVHSHQQPTFEEGGTARGRAGLLKTG